MARWSDRRLGASTVLLAVVWLVPAGYSIHAGLPHNPVDLPFEKSVQARTWGPQGWGFFTRDPREDRLSYLRRDAAGGWEPASLAPQSRPGNLFGIDRRARAQGVEAGLLLAQLDAEDWRRCDDPPALCLDDADASLRLDNPSPRPSLCGEIGFVLQPPVPWAWSRLPESPTMPSRVVRVVVRC